MNEFPKFYKVGAFALGVSNYLSFSGFAQIIPVEIIAVIAMIFVSLRSGEKKFRIEAEHRSIFLFGFLWIIAQAISNFINKSDFLESIKNIAQISVLLSLIYCGLYWAKRDSLILLYFFWGYLISSVPQYLFLPGLYGISDPWKFIFGPALTLSLLLLASRLTSAKSTLLLMFFPLLLIDFLLGARSLGLITILSVFMVLKVPLKQRGFTYSFFFLILISFLVIPVYSFYANLASEGSLGTAQQEKFLRQTQAGPILLVARSELIYELSAIRKTGILGLGSSPTVDNDFLQGVALEEFKFGVNHQSTSAYNEYMLTKKIPSHSMLFAAWMEAGVFGAIFWLYLTWLVLRNFFAATGRESNIGLATRYLSVNFLWAVLFSPLGAGSRMLIAITIILVLQKEISKERQHETAN